MSPKTSDSESFPASPGSYCVMYTHMWANSPFPPRIACILTSVVLSLSPSESPLRSSLVSVCRKRRRRRVRTCTCTCTHVQLTCSRGGRGASNYSYLGVTKVILSHFSRSFFIQARPILLAEQYSYSWKR